MRLGLVVAGALVGLGLVVAGIPWWRTARRRAATISRIAPALLEHGSFFALLDLAGTTSHYLERHGPMLRPDDILQRAKTGRLEVSGLIGRPVASTRWFRHDDLLAAVTSALEHWRSGARPDRGRFVFAFDHDVGEGFARGGGAKVTTRIAIVVIRRGAVITAYPLVAVA